MSCSESRWGSRCGSQHASCFLRARPMLRLRCSPSLHRSSHTTLWPPRMGLVRCSYFLPPGLVLWRRNPGRRQTILMGVVLAGLLLSKLYTPPEALLALILMLVLGRDGILKRPGAWHWKEMFTAFGIALLIFWAGYLFHISRLEVGHERVVMTFPNRPVKTLARASKAQFNLFLPAGEYAEGTRLVALSG